MNNGIAYRFRPNDPGIIVEIYLPKKAEYQGALYQALTQGFELDRVKEHFRSKKQAVGNFLDGYYRNEYTDELVENMTQIFDGYSMYEVDGVFYDTDSGTTIEERTQVIRIFFRPGLKNVPSSLSDEKKKRIIKDYLRFTGHRNEFAAEYVRKDLSADEQSKARSIANYLRGWECEVALFVFGYIVYEICRRIQEINEQMGKPVEKEILVTSLWNLTTNSVVSIGSSDQ